MTHLYIDSFLAGLIITNGLPAFIKGLTGQKIRTSLGKNSSAVLNVAWGWLNFAVGGLLLHYAHPRAHELRAFALFAFGSLVTALIFAYYNDSK